MAEGGKNQTSIEDTFYGKTVSILTLQRALQYAAIKGGHGELALLLNTKQGDSIRAAEKYSELKFANAESEAERRMAMELHFWEMREQAEKHKLVAHHVQQEIKQDQEQEMRQRALEYIQISQSTPKKD